MIIAPVTVRNLLGLHARAANVLAQSATQFKSRIMSAVHPQSNTVQGPQHISGQEILGGA